MKSCFNSRLVITNHWSESCESWKSLVTGTLKRETPEDTDVVQRIRIDVLTYSTVSESCVIDLQLCFSVLHLHTTPGQRFGKTKT